MKRLLSGLVLLFALTVFLPAQEPATAHKEASAGESEKGEMLGLKWINFGLLALGLGYLIAKNLPAYFRTRTGEIQGGIREAAKLKAEADARAKSVETKLANIGADIERLRTELRAEVAAEGERLKQETERSAARIREQAAQEITFLTKAARQELKSYSAALALDLARQRIQERLNGDTQHGLVDAFVHDLQHDAGQGMAAQ